MVNGKQAGEVWTLGTGLNRDGSAKVSFLRLFEGGHFVPTDQPSNSLDMIKRWVYDQSLEM
jgi:cathepsin A (carboxypeptidase C)